MKARSIISALALSALVTPAMALECITADQLSGGGPGPYTGSTHPIEGTEVQLWMGPYISGSGSLGGSSPPEIVPNECGGPTQFALKTNIANLYGILREPLVNVTITFCDGADQNNLSARVSSIDFVGSAQDADGQTLPGPFGTQAAVSLPPPTTGADIHDLKLDGHMFQFVFGGTETMILQVCGQR